MYIRDVDDQNIISGPCEQCKVSEHPIFHILENEGLDYKKSCNSCLVYPAGVDILEAGTSVKGIYCILSGKAKVYRYGESGKEQIIRFVKPGDVLGFRTLVTENPLKVSATTLEETSMCFIDRKDFKQMMDQSSGFRERVLKEIAQDLTDLVDALTDMAQRTVRSRLCSALLQLSDLYQDEPINLSREDLSGFVGTAQESVIRLLSEMKKEQLIEVKGRKITVIEHDKIQKMSLFG